mgnify:CR=1 FL=1
MVTAQAVTLKDSMKGENRMVRKGFKMFLNPGWQRNMRSATMSCG